MSHAMVNVVHLISWNAEAALIEPGACLSDRLQAWVAEDQQLKRLSLHLFRFPRWHPSDVLRLVLQHNDLRSMSAALHS